MSARPTLTASAVERWALFGGYWRIVEITEKRATVELCSCAGEPQQHLQTEDAQTIRYLRGATDGRLG